MLPSWAADTITIVRPSWVEERGKKFPDYRAPAETVTVTGCSVQPAGTSETLTARQAESVRLTVYAPPGTVIGAHDAVDFDGVRYAVDGRSQAWRSPTGAASNVIAYLVDWEG